MKIKKYLIILMAFFLCTGFADVSMFITEAYAESKLTVSDFMFYTEENGNKIPLPDLLGVELCSVNATVTTASEEEKTVCGFLAYYDENDKLLLVTADEGKVSADKEYKMSNQITTENVKAGMRVKAFLWEKTEEGYIPAVTEKILEATENIYVSPDGDDNSEGSFVNPVKTVQKAKSLVGLKNGDMTEDISVFFKEGTYCLEDTLSFSTEDSGTNGKRVIYQAYNGGNAIISGGKKLGEWEMHDEEKNIWKTKVNFTEKVRELYVDGKKAQRAKSEVRVYPVDFYKESEKILGYTVESEDVGLWENAGNIQLHFTQIWKNTLLNVDEIKKGSTEGTTDIILNRDAFEKTISSSRYVPLRGDTSFYVENAYELLDSEGEFYFNEENKELYYKPVGNTDMYSADCYVPVLDKLIEIEGEDLNNKVRNISFEGITFAHATRSDMDNGYLGDQAQEYDPIYEINSSYPVDNKFVGGNIRVSKAKNITFKNNIFMGLSAVGLGMYNGTENIAVEGNCFYDIGDSAITAGLPTDAFMEDTYNSGVNVALYKNVTSNGKTETSATQANDGDRTTIWSNPTNSLSDYLQIDLGKEYTISEVRIKARLGITDTATETYRGQTVHRRGFTVYASNDVEFKDGGTTLATVSNKEGNEFDYDEGFIGSVTAQGKFRYVRFSTTVNKYFPLAEIEIISPDETAQNKETCKNTIVSNNYITRSGDTNFGAPGIQLYHTENISVVHNMIKDVPYSGICVGWGWNNIKGSQTTKNNIISYNIIDGFATKMYDAGGVYMNGPQINTQINNNYIKHQKNIYYALYADTGADNFTATNNVFEDVDYVFALGRTGNLSSLNGVTLRNNYSTSVKYNYAFTDGSESVVENPVFYLRTKPSDEVSAIIASAGIENDYKYIISKVPYAEEELSTEDIYGDVIDRHTGYYTDAYISLTDYNLILYYLDNKISDAKAILSAGSDYASTVSYYMFDSTIKTIYNEMVAFINETKDSEGVISHLTENVDRKAVIETRVRLEKAIDDFLASLE